MDFFGILFDIKNGKKIPYSKTYFDTLFAAKLAEMQIKTLTGTLPLTFTAKGGAVSDWVIYGNDDNGTENLFDIESVNAITDLNDNKGLAFTQPGYYLVKSYSNTNGYFYGRVYENGTAVGSYYYIKAQASLTTAQITLSQGQTLYLYDPLSANLSLTEAKDQIATYKIYVEYSSTVMPIAPDHYIPYQQGVGERTANEFDKTVNELTNGYNLDGSTGLPISDASRAATLNPISVNSSTYTLTYDTSSENVYNAIYSVLNGNTLVRRVAGLQSGDTLDASGGDTVYICFYSTVVVDVDNISNIMLVRGSTAPDHFIPYGYEIPIRLRGENLFDYTTLTAGYFIDVNGVITANSSWAISDYIPVNANTAYLVTNYSPIANSAYDAVYDVNKNLLGTIKVKSDIDTTFETPQDAKYVRLSIRTAASAQYTVEMFSFNDYTLYIGSTPLRAGQSISKTSTGVDLELSEGENTVSTALYNKPTMTITYK